MKRILRWMVVFGAAAALGACAGAGDGGGPAASSGSGGGGYKVGTPYQIGGVWYTPVEDYTYEEVGTASWYGAKFHGRRTANGEIFDKNKVSAAHRTLPMPSVVEVTNLENGRSLVVRVNDRGPFARGRIIDMSKRGAELLGFAAQGTAQVHVRVLEQESRALKMQATQIASGAASDTVIQAASLPASAPVAVDSEDLLPPPQANGAQQSDGGPTVIASGPAAEAAPSESASPAPAASADSGVFVQAGSFREQGNASRMSDALRDYGPTRVIAADIAGERYYRVQLGPFSTMESGNEMVWTLRDAGIDGARVIAQ